MNHTCKDNIKSIWSRSDIDWMSELQVSATWCYFLCLIHELLYFVSYVIICCLLPGVWEMEGTAGWLLAAPAVAAGVPCAEVQSGSIWTPGEGRGVWASVVGTDEETHHSGECPGQSSTCTHTQEGIPVSVS